MKEKIDLIIDSREWSFTEISNLRETIDSIVQEVEGGLTSSEQLNLIWDDHVNADNLTFGNVFTDLLKTRLSAELLKEFR